MREGCLLLMNALAVPTLPLVVASSYSWTIEALASVPLDAQQAERYDESSPYTHILDTLRYWVVNRRTASPYTPPGPGRTIMSGMHYRIY